MINLYNNTIQDHFELIVSEFMYLPWKYLETQIVRRTNTLNEASSTQSITIMAAENIETTVADFLRNKVTLYSQKSSCVLAEQENISIPLFTQRKGGKYKLPLCEAQRKKKQ